MADSTKHSETTNSATTKSLTLYSWPTAFKVTKFRWWIPMFVYRRVIGDIEEISMHQYETLHHPPYYKITAGNDLQPSDPDTKLRPSKAQSPTERTR
jgi:hypothetical protein